MREYILNTQVPTQSSSLPSAGDPASESKQEALFTLRSLAEGKHPLTGTPLPDESCYQSAKVLRALLTGIEALEKTAKVRNRSSSKPLPAAAGKPWTTQEEERLVVAFEEGGSLADLANKHQRTKYAIESRLIKLGKMMPPITPIK